MNLADLWSWPGIVLHRIRDIVDLNNILWLANQDPSFVDKSEAFYRVSLSLVKISLSTDTHFTNGVFISSTLLLLIISIKPTVLRKLYLGYPLLPVLKTGILWLLYHIYIWWVLFHILLQCIIKMIPGRSTVVLPIL